ncbi:Chemotaxis response regulator protein-glutamate methylesterase [Lacunisphaera limnophila]|uniref:Protein-glutamate methylesterase/protein-glutamine glutaminase n=1 Tax=Lacunisphaera limnophila TaxID=1838286 RepID=A0A1D8AXK2_9BACT|nr:chemotaxis response regulator protein-glutamate methylesterase [Lacunisphaera limnophila]AOS45614.1 Chemotaxis response regulator protein-glutamate methylesterase [Lacunisphaera limnophila]
MPKLRALVVDDAVVMRRLVATVLESDPAIEVAGSAANGRIALQKLTQVNPDFVTLDMEMPELDGLATLREIRRTHPRLPVIMLSLATRRGAVATLDALAAGASDYVTKPSDVANLEQSIALLQHDLLPRIHAHCRIASPAPVPATPGHAASTRPGAACPHGPAGGAELLVIATSTGGPNALCKVFSGLTRPVPVPVAIVQHMPPLFTETLAHRLDTLSPHLRCKEAAEGDILQAGHAYLAPGGRHLALERLPAGDLVCRLLDTPPENSCRPAADVLFRSAAAVAGGHVLAVVMTGMGHDGLRGCEHIHEAGGSIILQDEASSIVWGMPGAVAHAGLTRCILPLGEIAPQISRQLTLVPA